MINLQAFCSHDEDGDGNERRGHAHQKYLSSPCSCCTEYSVHGQWHFEKPPTPVEHSTQCATFFTPLACLNLKLQRRAYLHPYGLQGLCPVVFPMTNWTRQTASLQDPSQATCTAGPPTTPPSELQRSDTAKPKLLKKRWNLICTVAVEERI